jgi:hypothetical protein
MGLRHNGMNFAHNKQSVSHFTTMMIELTNTVIELNAAMNEWTELTQKSIESNILRNSHEEQCNLNLNLH